MKRHWSEAPTPCICGKGFRSMIAEAKHRHNFPALCNKDGLRRFYAQEAERKPDRAGHGHN